MAAKTLLLTSVPNIDDLVKTRVSPLDVRFKPLALDCPGLMETPKSAKVRAIGERDGEGHRRKRRQFSDEYTR